MSKTLYRWELYDSEGEVEKIDNHVYSSEEKTALAFITYGLKNKLLTIEDQEEAFKLLTTGWKEWNRNNKAVYIEEVEFVD